HFKGPRTDRDLEMAEALGAAPGRARATYVAAQRCLLRIVRLFEARDVGSIGRKSHHARVRRLRSLKFEVVKASAICAGAGTGSRRAPRAPPPCRPGSGRTCLRR